MIFCFAAGLAAAIVVGLRLLTCEWPEGMVPGAHAFGPHERAWRAEQPTRRERRALALVAVRERIAERSWSMGAAEIALRMKAAGKDAGGCLTAAAAWFRTTTDPAAAEAPASVRTAQRRLNRP
jgi:hypothetical protein